MDLGNIIAENRKKTIIHYLRAIRKIKNPEAIKVIDEDKHFYSHTNTRGLTTYYKVFDTFYKYKKSRFYNSGLYYISCNGFWIVCTHQLDFLYDLDKEDSKENE